MLSYKSHRSADLPRVNDRLGRRPWYIQASSTPLLERFLRKAETDRDEIRAYGWGIAGQAVEELQLDEAANTWGLHSA